MKAVLSQPMSKILLTIVAGLSLLIGITLLLRNGVSRSQYPPRINITRAQYDHALASWQALHVEEYEITTNTQAFLGGELTLHVTDYGNKVEELAPNLRPLDTLTTADIDSLKQDTVEGMFAQVDAILGQENALFKTGIMSGSGDFYMSYSIGFDPVLGYPALIQQLPVTAPGSYIFDADAKETVTNLKLIKYGK
jgi:hypothetical protein